jgi:hypothetical protein
MSDWRDTGARLTKLVALAASPNEHEAAIARDKALAVLAAIDLDLLDTLSDQRDKLIDDCHAELRRISSARAARPNAHTASLASRAQLLLGHYRNLDALPAIVALARQLADAR